MRSQRTTLMMTRIGSIAAAALWLAASPAAAQPAANAHESQAEGEVRLRLERPGVGQAPALNVIFQNDSPRDVAIQLGEVIGDGYGGMALLPFAVGFEVSGPDGRRQHLSFLDPAHVNVGGRTDPYIVPLRSGSSYSLRIRLDHLWHDPLIHPFVKPSEPVPHVTITAVWTGVVETSGAGWFQRQQGLGGGAKPSLVSNPLNL